MDPVHDGTSNRRRLISAANGEPAMVASLRGKYQTLCVHRGKFTGKYPDAMASAPPSFGSVLLSVMLFSELMYLGVSWKDGNGQAISSLDLTALLFTHAEGHNKFSGDRVSLHDFFFSDFGAASTLAAYQSGFENDTAGEILFTWEDVCAVGLETFQGSRFRAARDSLDQMIVEGTRKLEQSSYPPQTPTRLGQHSSSYVAEGHTAAQLYPQAWYKDAFSIRHNGQDQFELEETQAFQELQESDSDGKIIWTYVRGSHSVDTESLNSAIDRVVEKLKRPHPEFPAATSSLIDGHRVTRVKLPDLAFQLLSRRVALGLLMGEARSLQYEHDIKARINEEISIAKLEVAKYGEWKSVTLHFSLSTLGWQYVMPAPGKQLPLRILNGDNLTEAWHFDVYPPRQGYHVTARIYIPTEETSFDFLWDAGLHQEVNLCVSLPLTVKGSSLEYVDLLHKTFKESMGEQQSNVVSSLLRRTEFVPALPLQIDHQLFTASLSYLRQDLNKAQKEAFDVCLAGVPHGHLNITGVTETGKSMLAAHLSLALACSHPVLVVTQNSSEAQNLETLLLSKHGQLRRELKELHGAISLCRVFPAYKVRTAIGLRLFSEELNDASATDQQLKTALLNTSATDLALHKTVKHFACHISLYPDQYDDREKQYAELYLQALETCREAPHKSERSPHYFRLFDHCAAVLGEYLLPRMDIVITTVDAAVNGLSNLYRPGCIILAEAGMMSVPTGVQLVESFKPKLLVTFQDPTHSPQVHSSVEEGCNEMRDLLGKCLLDLPLSMHTVALDRNMRGQQQQQQQQAALVPMPAPAPAPAPSSRGGRPRGSRAVMYRPSVASYYPALSQAQFDALSEPERRRRSHIARIEEDPGASVVVQPGCRRCRGKHTCRRYTPAALRQFDPLSAGKGPGKCAHCRWLQKPCEV